MRVDDNDPRPAYVQVAASLRARIASGDLSPGQRLPSGRELAREYGVALMTAQKAVDGLRSEGLVTPQRGRGVFVLSPGQQAEATLDIDGLREAVTDLRRRVEALEQGDQS